MATAIVSDLHLGTTACTDLVRRADVRERLLEALAQADRVVLLGDTLELRERPAPEVLELARPLLDGLAQATAGKELVLVPGNHDHELVAPAVEAARLDVGGPLAPDTRFDPRVPELTRRLTERLAQTDVVLAYPGLWLREDVYATHGHYLDRHLTVPRMECVLGSAVARFAGPPTGDASPADRYEAALAPIYAFAHSVAQSPRRITKGGTVSRDVWRRSNPDGRTTLAGLALGRVAIPAAVAALNAAGLGPFRTDISSAELRRSGLRAMAETIEAMGVKAGHVIFGHTHRAGPREGEAEEWRAAGGARLTNTGSWIYEGVFLDGTGPENPYWPGRVTWLRDSGPPEQAQVLEGLELPPAGG